MKTISSQLLNELDLFSAAEYDAIYGPAELDEHDEFNASFERMRVATGPHLPISMTYVVWPSCYECGRQLPAKLVSRAPHVRICPDCCGLHESEIV